MAITINEQNESVGICREEALWRHLINLSHYERHCSLIHTVRVLAHSSRQVRSEWTVTFGDVPFSWVQFDTVDYVRREMSSESISGDFATLRMKWNIQNRSSRNVHLVGSLVCEPDAPLIEVSCAGTLQSHFQLMLKELIAAHLHNAEEDSINERHYKRISVDYQETIDISGVRIEVRIADFSCGGMAFRITKGKLPVPDGSVVRWQVDGVSVKGRIFIDCHHGIHRLSFTRPLGEKLFRELFARWSNNRAQPDEFIQFYDVLQAPESTGVRIRSRLRH